MQPLCPGGLDPSSFIFGAQHGKPDWIPDPLGGPWRSPREALLAPAPMDIAWSTSPIQAYREERGGCMSSSASARGRDRWAVRTRGSVPEPGRTGGVRTGSGVRIPPARLPHPRARRWGAWWLGWGAPRRPGTRGLRARHPSEGACSATAPRQLRSPQLEEVMEQFMGIYKVMPD